MQPELPVYLDNNATTRVDEEVVETMLPYFTQHYGNAASATHSKGWIARDAMALATERVANLIGSETGELVFTSGATESINLALKGAFEAYQKKGNHIITVATEHKAVLDVCKTLEKKGAEVTYLPVNSDGLINLNQLEEAIKETTILVCIMVANNETGAIQPIEQIAGIVHRHGLVFMSDASQALGKISVNVNTLGIDLMPFSGHKFYGPKGVGALYVRRRNPRVRLVPQIDGGGHQRNLRSGTLNVPGIVGLGKACEVAQREMDNDMPKVEVLRNQLESELLKLSGVKVNGSVKHRLPNTMNVSIDHVLSEDLMRELANKVAVSSGSACTSVIKEPSYVLKAMGLSDEDAYASVRISLSKYNTMNEVEYAAKAISDSIVSLRSLSPA